LGWAKEHSKKKKAFQRGGTQGKKERISPKEAGGLGKFLQGGNKPEGTSQENGRRKEKKKTDRKGKINAEL